MPGSKGMPRGEREVLILDAATEEFGLQGYAYASIDRVAGQAGISKQMVYNYFGSKARLYVACTHRAGTALIEQFAATQPDSHTDREPTSVDALFQNLEPGPSGWAIIFDRTLPPGGEPYEVASHYRRKLAQISKIWAAGPFSDFVARDESDVLLVTQMWFGAVAAVVQWWVDHPKESAQSVSRRCTRILTALDAK